jgi:hypothetical protein
MRPTRYGPLGPQEFSDGFLLFVFVAIVLTLIGLVVARIWRNRRDAALSEVSEGWTFRSQLPINVGAPYDRFAELRTNQPFDVSETTDEGFKVSFFDVRDLNGHPLPCTIVQLPVEAPLVRRTDAPCAPVGIGPRTADVLSGLGGLQVETAPLAEGLASLRAQTAPFALLVRSTGASRPVVDRAALRLAHAIVADAQGNAPIR